MFLFLVSFCYSSNTTTWMNPKRTQFKQTIMMISFILSLLLDKFAFENLGCFLFQSHDLRMLDLFYCLTFKVSSMCSFLFAHFHSSECSFYDVIVISSLSFLNLKLFVRCKMKLWNVKSQERERLSEVTQKKMKKGQIFSCWLWR